MLMSEVPKNVRKNFCALYGSFLNGRSVIFKLFDEFSSLGFQLSNPLKKENKRFSKVNEMPIQTK